MNRLLRTIIAVGISSVGASAVSASDYYFGSDFNGYPQRFGRGYGCPQYRSYENLRSSPNLERFGCDEGVCAGRFRGYGNNYGRISFDCPRNLPGQFIPNRPPIGNQPVSGQPFLRNTPLGDPSRFQSDPGRPAPLAPSFGQSEVSIPQKQKGIANLPLAEQKIALKQAICPVTREPLGSMGTPIKVQLGDRSIYVCCQGCVSTLMEDPMKYLPNVESFPGSRQIR